MKFGDLVFPEKLIVDEETKSDFYAKFIAEPFERGYGHTLGNSLRRVLLSSLTGAAVTAVRIRGGVHEYSTLKGIKEDILEIILNLKKLRFRMYKPGPKILYLKTEKEGEVLAKDIKSDSDIEIINKDQIVATLDSGANLEMEIEVSSGRGYLPKEKQQRENLPVGTILTDATFTPVSRVNYDVEMTRVGYATDYDRLIIEIWTDGSISPEDALAYASKVVRDSLSIFILPEEKVEESVPEKEQIDEKKLKDVLSQSVTVLNLSIRASNCLKHMKISTIRDLVRKEEEELLSFKNFGTKSLNEVKIRLSELNPVLHFGMDV